jgi:hypothetical protein
MLSQETIQELVDALVLFSSGYLIQFMVYVFVVGVTFRALIFYTISREYWFAREFKKRADAFDGAEGGQEQPVGFFSLTKLLLERTYYEAFEIRSMLRRRKPDTILAFGDRAFLVQHGCARLVRDTLSQIRFLRFNNPSPRFKDIAKHVFEENPCFKRVFGMFSNGLFNDVLNILPGLLIIGGIFGTFLGIMKALPELGNMDLGDVAGSNSIMDHFLLKISFSMSTSIIGILLSIMMTVFNSVFSPEKLFLHTVDIYENTLVNLWDRSSDNEAFVGDEFDEHKDPIQALAEQALVKEIAKDMKVLKLYDSSFLRPEPIRARDPLKSE